MSFSIFGSQLLTLSSIWLFTHQVSCGSMTAWWTDLGPSFLMQDDESGDIRYSLCNSNNTPILPEDKSLTVPLSTYPPKNGTALAGTGWWDGSRTQASIFYQDKVDAIINSNLECDWATGKWTNTGNWIVSAGAPSISSSTGLAAVLLGVDGGYRVFYHDGDNKLRHLGYTPKTSWCDYGPVSNDEVLGSAIGATFRGDNITAVTPRDLDNIEVSRLNSDESWHISTFPQPLTTTLATNATNKTTFALNTITTPNFTLPSWDGSPGAIGVSLDSNYTRFIFYIGNDTELYQVANVDNSWRLLSRPSATFWPKADDPKGPLAVANNYASNNLRIYYVSGGKVIEANGDDNTWSVAAALPSVHSSVATGTVSSNSNSSASAADSSLSTGAKAGIGVGVSLGAAAIGGIASAICFLRRRQQKKDAAGEAHDGFVNGTHPHSPGTQYGQAPYQDYQNTGYHSQGGYDTHGNWISYTPQPQEKDGVIQVGELRGAANVHEMPQNTRTMHEMIGEGHYREVP